MRSGAQGLVQRRSILEALFVLGAIWQQPSLADGFLLADQQRMLRIYKNIQRLSPENQKSLAPELPMDAVGAKVAELKSSTSGVHAPTSWSYSLSVDEADRPFCACGRCQLRSDRRASRQ